MSKILPAVVLAAALAAGLTGLPATPAAASPRIFCGIGYHLDRDADRCVKDKHHHHGHH